MMDKIEAAIKVKEEIDRLIQINYIEQKGGVLLWTSIDIMIDKIKILRPLLDDLVITDAYFKKHIVDSVTDTYNYVEEIYCHEVFGRG